jgi:hypothetical protein
VDASFLRQKDAVRTNLIQPPRVDHQFFGRAYGIKNSGASVQSVRCYGKMDPSWFDPISWSGWPTPDSRSSW